MADSHATTNGATTHAATRATRRSAPVVVVVVLMALTAIVVGCGDDDDSSGDATSTTGGGEAVGLGDLAGTWTIVHEEPRQFDTIGTCIADGPSDPDCPATTEPPFDLLWTDVYAIEIDDSGVVLRFELHGDDATCEGTAAATATDIDLDALDCEASRAVDTDGVAASTYEHQGDCLILVTHNPAVAFEREPGACDASTPSTTGTDSVAPSVD